MLSMPSSYKEDNWADQVSSVRKSARGLEQVKLSEDIAAGKGLAGAVVICELWGLVVAL
jgi:hypothetical protein